MKVLDAAELSERRYWKDGRKVTHILFPFLEFNMLDVLKPLSFSAACGRSYTGRGYTTGPTTCFACLAVPRPLYRCDCGHLEALHTPRGCLNCVTIYAPAQHVYVPNHANRGWR